MKKEENDNFSVKFVIIAILMVTIVTIISLIFRSAVDKTTVITGENLISLNNLFNVV